MAGPIVVVCSGPGVDIGERGRTRGVSVLGWMDAVAMNLASLGRTGMIGAAIQPLGARYGGWDSWESMKAN